MRTLTDEERELAVELLRCAADGDSDGWLVGYCRAQVHLGVEDGNPVDVTAWAARNAAVASTPEELPGDDGTDEHYRTALLEAAQRIEEGRWP